MTLRNGTYEIGPSAGRLLVRTSRSGLGRRAGHDLTIEATRWSGTATVADLSLSSAEVTIEVDALEVREGSGGVLPLSPFDRSEIKKNLRKVLDVGRHPDMTFRSTAVIEGASETFTVEGDLTVRGTTRTAVIRVTVDGHRVTGSATVVQSRWGIKPYSAFFGALKLADEVEVTFDLRL